MFLIENLSINQLKVKIYMYTLNEENLSSNNFIQHFQILVSQKS